MLKIKKKKVRKREEGGEGGKKGERKSETHKTSQFPWDPEGLVLGNTSVR